MEWLCGLLLLTTRSRNKTIGTPNVENVLVMGRLVGWFGGRFQLCLSSGAEGSVGYSTSVLREGRADRSCDGRYMVPLCEEQENHFTSYK